jgi:hypothetical protein
MSESVKATEERGIFERFAQDAKLVVRPQSIIQPDSPDIRCEIEGLGRVEFELVQLDAQGELQRMRYFLRVREFWSDAIKALKPEVLQRHRGAQINVQFHPTANQGQRRGALRAFVAALSDLPEGAQGPMPNLPAGVVSAELKHSHIDTGPEINERSVNQVNFESAAFAPVGIDLSRIDDKIAKYSAGWGARAELLAYARWGMPFTDQMHKAPGYLAERFPAGIFARGWIYELNSHSIVACTP